MSDPLLTCPSCHSAAVFARTRKQVYECDDCGHVWPMIEAAKPAVDVPLKPLKLFLS